MATAIQKIASLGERRDIPFNKLVLSEANVRKIKNGLSIDELAGDIARRGLLKNLNVRPVVDAAGVETGMFEVPAGGRRYLALAKLVKAKRLARSEPIPCSVRAADSDISAEEDSLAENVRVVALHPLDQFRAFKAMVDGGDSEQEIAARFFVSPMVVRQRMRLASVAPALLEAYAEDQMTLDHLMAFTVNADHARQLAVWEAVSRDPYRSAHTIKRQLTQGAISMRDRRVQFIGLTAYEEAGGSALRDLFSPEDGGWVEDAGLVEMLANEQLREEAEKLAGEGWKWIEIAIDFPYGHTNGLRVLEGVGARLTEEEQNTRDAFVEELDALYAAHDGEDDLPNEVDQRLGELETAIEAFDNRPVLYDASEVTRAGAFISIDGNGNLRIERGFVRPEDEAQIADGSDGADLNGAELADPAVQRAVITIGGELVSDAGEDEEDALKPLSERLLGELSAHRTLALRNALAEQPQVALTLLLHRLVSGAFRSVSAGSCLQASVSHVFFPVQGAELKESISASAIHARHAAWQERFPAGDQPFWDWLAGLDDQDRLALLAHCVSYGVNALIEKVDRHGGSGITQHGLDQRIGQADRLARAVGLDMVAAGWQPTVETYLGKVTKPRILEAVREAGGDRAAQLIDHLKKGDMANEAERLLADSGWLPEALRTPLLEEAAAPTAGDDGDVILPAFLANDEDASSAGAEDVTGDESGTHRGDGEIAIAAE
ncbi:MAG: plasmid partitioning protein [Bradyrhizobium sp.]|nr:plasmid partitioning protein [Bradyrhizobium sp.]